MTINAIQSRPESLGDLVYDAIRMAIVERKLTSTDPITEASLSKQLGVSKTPVREALLRLEYIGLIQSGGERRPSYAVKPSISAIQHAFELREPLETCGAALAAKNATMKDRKTIKDLARATFPARWSDSRDFHFRIAEVTRNPYLVRHIADAFDLTWALQGRDLPVGDDSLLCADQHIGIAEAITEGDSRRASERMAEHLKTAKDLVIRIHGQASAGGASTD